MIADGSRLLECLKARFLHLGCHLFDMVLQLVILSLYLHQMLDQDYGMVQRHRFLLLFCLDDTGDSLFLLFRQNDIPKSLSCLIVWLVLDNLHVLSQTDQLVGQGVEDRSQRLIVSEGAFNRSAFLFNSHARPHTQPSDIIVDALHDFFLHGELLFSLMPILLISYHLLRKL